MLIDEYAAVIHSTLDRICETQRDNILQAAEYASRVIENDGLIYVFGCGHSHILADETFYRAGGLACVAPVFCESLMLHKGAVHSSKLEKRSGYATRLLEKYPFRPEDMLICISTSDKNAAPVEYAQAVRAMGIPVVGVGSSFYFAESVCNACGKHLHEVCDIFLDNLVPYGDACLHPATQLAAMAPLSTITGAFLINSVLAQAAELAQQRGATVPIYLSGNIAGGAEQNALLIDRYAPRIGHL